MTQANINIRNIIFRNRARAAITNIAGVAAIGSFLTATSPKKRSYEQAAAGTRQNRYDLNRHWNRQIAATIGQHIANIGRAIRILSALSGAERDIRKKTMPA
ncbi:hypothetical protein [Candidatus Tokpelaia sp.]|uniref:hypothetical protein n=1 Tax=Candidatus Tokpelaia sp. TaxID=2233777 RepID=UPI00123AB716|nr:hypothetical protein [Candidatus Tokpelaia sp.]